MVFNSHLKSSVPQNWLFRSMEGSYAIERGISYTSAEIADGIGIPMLNLACIDKDCNYRDGELKFINSQISGDKLLQPGDLLIACTDLTRNADIVGCPILVPDDGVNYTYSMDMARLLPDPEIFNSYFLYSALRQPFYHNYIKQFASGTNVMHLNLDGISWYKMLVPPLKVQQRYGQLVQNIHKQRSKVLVENRQLYAIRSWLLPMLMSGQATLAD